MTSVSSATIYATLKATIAITTVMALAFAGWTAGLYIAAPVEDLRGIVTYTPPFKDYTREAGLRAPDNLTMEEMPVDLILATLVAEDIEFPTHIGLRPRVLYDRLKALLNTRERVSGASTLTQQLAKNIFTGARRHWYRKYAEALYALKIERHFTKEEIFTLYANMAQTGPDFYGYKQAARDYFGKIPGQLTAVEAVFIVNNMPSPVRRSAWRREGVSDPSALHRTTQLLQRTLLLKAQLIPFDDPTREEKRAFFSRYMGSGDPVNLRPGLWPADFYSTYLLNAMRAVCLTDETYHAIRKRAEETARHFVESDTHF